jgi:hypothetical protein
MEGYGTLSIHRHIQVPNLSISPKDLAEVVFSYVFGKLFDHYLLSHYNQTYNHKIEEDGNTLVLLTGLGDLPRLTLRLSLL